MAYLPNDVPGPRPRVHDRTFWNYCQQRELRFQRCAACQVFRHPPAPVCPHCRSFESDWIRAPESGVVFSFTLVHHPAHPAVAPIVPYNVVVVDFPECGHARLVSNVIDAKPEEIRIGMLVSLVWETAGNGMLVPRFVKK
ncbi:MAG: Zn-ribbon domain-containing OB-fold protein [Candidatus Binatia bacterium]